MNIFVWELIKRRRNVLKQREEKQRIENEMRVLPEFRSIFEGEFAINGNRGSTIKKLELRERPWVNKSIDQMNCLTCKVDKNNPNLYSKNTRSASKSFPSNHAANTFSLAIIVSFFFPKFKKILFGLAFTISFSRIYIGVHYPFDIVFGIGLGILSSYLVKLIFNLYLRKIN